MKPILFLAACVVLVVFWPLALLLLIVLPILWLVTLPFRLVFLSVEAALRLVRAILFLPARILGG
jgi:hypothetical protein